MGLNDFKKEGSNFAECSCGESFQATSRREVMGEAIDHLVTEHGLFDRVELPWAPPQAEKNVLISEEGVRVQKYRDDKRNIQNEYELSTGNYVNTSYGPDGKERHINTLAAKCGEEFTFDW